VIGLPEQLALPTISGSFGISSATTVREAGLELVPVLAVCEKAFGDGHWARAESIRMEMQRNPSV
jgi:hypothetical protein